MEGLKIESDADNSEYFFVSGVKENRFSVYANGEKFPVRQSNKGPLTLLSAAIHPSFPAVAFSAASSFSFRLIPQR
jgi:hypothetical protein